MFRIPVFSNDSSEMDVREVLVTPMLMELGFSEEEISRERTVILGSGTPVRTDYIVETDPENPFDLPSSRIVVEMKRPRVPLTSDVLDQAVSYSSHRLIDACHIVLTNGVNLQIFEFIGTTPEKLLDVLVAEISVHWHRIVEVIGAEKIRSFFAGTEVIRDIGSGGFGRVFTARHRRLQRVEALKILHPSVESRSSMNMRFKRGATGLAQLRHPYICEVFDIGVYRGRPFHRMEYIDGVDVVAYVNANSLSLDGRVALFLKICEGIVHAHAQHISHCDLKPANILVTNDGTPKIIDFDLCHIGENASTIVTQIGATIAYMDRTIWNNPENRDSLADIYSLGLVLWSMITGKVLTADWTADDLMLGLRLNDAEQLGQIVLRCVTLDRRHRPQSVTDLKGFCKITEWHSPVEGLLDGAVGPLACKDPRVAYELQFQLWKQNGGLPTNVDFVFISRGLPDNPATQDEKDFIFRSACAHWRKPLRAIFAKWPTADMLASATKVIGDRTLDPSQTGAVAENHPARRAFDILATTDEYRTRTESEEVARFYLEVLKSGRRPSMFHNILDDMARLQCFKKGKSILRKEASGVMIELVRARLPNITKGARKQIGKLIDKLSPTKCGDDSEEVVKLARGVSNDPVLYTNAVQLLAVMNSPHATDALIDILEGSREFRHNVFCFTLPWAIGLKGNRIRTAVIDYLTELGPLLDSDLKSKVDGTLAELRVREKK
ncbi:MAG: protein kinase [Pyrinomonadaceae bacterium]